MFEWEMDGGGCVIGGDGGAVLRSQKQRLIEIHAELQRSGQSVVGNPELLSVYQAMEVV